MTRRELLYFVLFVLEICDEVTGGCNLSLKDDFGNPSPVYLKNGDFLAPNSTGAILLRRSETLQIACPGTKRVVVLGNKTTASDIFDVKCVKDSVFRASKGSWVGNLKEIKCSGPPWFSAEEVGRCTGGHVLYRVGYKIADVFHSLYEACFDKYLIHTLYVKHTLKPNSLHIQAGGRRPQFIEGDVFGKVRMSQLYAMKYQLQRLGKILGDGTETQYITKNQFLNRGHLAPRADFPLHAEQRASFHYVNTAPQWRRGNAGDWAALEDALRRRVNAYGNPLTVYTGTYGVTTLVDKNSIPKDFFLEVDANNNDIVPVPLYFYKVVYDPIKNTSATFISINSSYYNTTMLTKLSFCEDICESNPKYSWLRWRSNDGTHSFCCTYEDFVKKINMLPELKVKGLFF
ncbi:unnamed protein product, partial [Brenthis ino]